MAPEENNDDSVQKSGKPKARWGLTLLLLLVFLAGGGFYALNSMKDAAHKLASDANQGELTDDSLYSAEGGRQAGPGVEFGAEQGAVPQKGAAGSSLNPELKPGWVKDMVAARAGDQTGARSSGYAPEEEERAAQGGGTGKGASAQPGDDTMGAKLQARAGFKHQAPSANKTSAPAAPMQFNGAEVGKPSVQKETKAAAPKKGGAGGVMDALKGAFRASLYGARIASQDSAKSWVAKSFDANEDAGMAIEYDEKMKAKLDVVNPNSIPKFLREQDISAAEAKTLTAAKVGKPEGDMEGTKAALKADKDYQSKKGTQNVTDGVLNGLFSGVAGGGSEDGEDYVGEDPLSKMNLFETDEYGNTIVPGEDGMTYIFGTDGSILGCEDSGAGMCLIAGASDSCSADLTLGDMSGGAI